MDEEKEKEKRRRGKIVTPLGSDQTALEYQVQPSVHPLSPAMSSPWAAEMSPYHGSSLYRAVG